MSQPFEPFGSQDKKDDDGQVIDSFFIETDAPPEYKDAIEPIIVRALDEPRKITRIFSGDITMAVDWDPVMIVPPDANRKALQIYVYSPTSVATDGARFSDDKGLIRTSGKVLHNGTVPFDSHTGAVFAVPSGNAAGGLASAPVSIEYWSVSE